MLRSTTARRRLVTRAAVEACEPRRLMASVSGVVYNDLDRDGARDAGENGLSGVTVYADKNYSGTRDAGELGAVTAGDGTYRISGILADGKSNAIRLLNLPAGATVTAPAGGAHSARFASEYEAGNRNFGVATAPTQPTSYTVSGTIFQDADNDGVRDAGEGLTGGTVFVDYDGDGVRDGDEPSATTDTGTYQLTVKPGAYEVRFLGYDAATPATSRLLDSGDVQTSAVGAAAARFDTSAPASLTNRSVGAGLAYTIRVMPTIDVAGTSLNDEQLAELTTTSAGPYYAWRDVDADGVRDANEPSVGRRPDYVDFVPAFEIAILSGQAYRIGIATSDAVGAAAVAVVGGVSNGPDAPRPRVAPTHAAVVGYLFIDSDRDGTLDNGEFTWDHGALEATTVFADYDNDGVLDANEPSDRVRADPSDPTNLVGVYVLKVQPGVTFGVRTFTVGSEYYGTEKYEDYKQTTTPTIAVPANTYVGRDVGIAVPAATPTPAATVTGTVFNDADKDGVRDAGEAGVAGKTVYGDLNYNNFRDANEPTALSNASGFYSLSIPTGPNSVAVRLVPEAGTTVTAPAGGFHSGRFTTAYTAGNRNFGVATTAAQTTRLTLETWTDWDGDGSFDAAEAEGAAAYSLDVWLDLNRNGLRETGEPAMPRDTNPAVPLASYIADVAPGTYTVAVRRAGDVDAYADYSLPVTVGPGETWTLYLAIPTTSTVAGLVYSDADGDGTRDPGEAAVSGQIVFADYDYDGVRDAGEPSAVTAADGRYKVVGVRSDNQLFWLTLADVPSGATVTQPTGGVHKNRFDRAYDVNGRDFGIKPATQGTVTLEGLAYYDENGNGTRDGVEIYKGLDGIVVYADYDGDGRLDANEPSATTAASDGTFTLSNVLRQPTTIRAIAPTGAITTGAYADGYAFTPSASTGTQTLPPIGVNRHPTTPNFSGTIFNDVDRDFVLDAGEAGAAGVRVFIDGDADSTYDAGETAVLTDADGGFALSVPTADFALAMVDFAQAATKGFDAGSAYVYHYFSSSPTRSGLDLAVAPLAYASVSGQAFFDKDYSGDFNAGDTAHTGSIFADLNENQRLDAGEPSSAINTTTAAYSLANVPAGRTYLYVLRTGSYDGGSVLNLAAGEARTGHHVRTYDSAVAESVYAFIDNDGDGRQDVNDTTREKLLDVWIDTNGNSLFDAGEQRAKLNDDGVSYTIQNPVNGYAGKLVYRRVGDADPFADGSTGLYDFSAPDEQPGGYSFALAPRTQYGTVSGTVFVDDNGNGVREARDVSFEAAHVYADLNNNGTFDPAEPDAYATYASGAYRFTVAPGTYTVRVEPRSGNSYDPITYYQTAPAGGNGRSVTVANGATAGSVVFGMARVNATATVSGTVFNDANGNGVRDAGEGPFSDRSVNVFADYNDNGVWDQYLEPWAPADAAGNYTVGGVRSDGTSVRIRVDSYGVTAANVTTPVGGAYSARYFNGQTKGGLIFGIKI